MPVQANDKHAPRDPLEELFKQVPVAISLLDGPQHITTFANEAYRNLFVGRDVVGKPLLESVPELDERALGDLLRRVLDAGEPSVVNEVPVIRSDPATGVTERGCLNFVLSPYRGATGAVTRIFVCVQDVTELVRAREVSKATTAELEAIFRSAPDGIYVGGPDGIWRANEPALAMLGYSSVADLNRNIGELAREIETRRLDTGELISGEDQAFSRALAGKLDVQDVQVRDVRTGEHRVVRSACAPIRVEDKIVGAVAINSDITTRIRAEAVLRERTDFEQQLIGIVSHDLRSPLSAIALGVASLLRREDTAERTKLALLRVQSAVERATRLVKDLLDFTLARSASGVPLQKQRVDARIIASQVADELSANWPERDIRVESEGDGVGEWDADRVAQILMNLASNAISYSDSNTAVTIRTRGEANAVVLEVHNRGAVISPEVRDGIFEPMQRNETVDKLGRSVGLGLYIVKKFVEAHGGTVALTSTAETGTTFIVRLPRR